MLFSGFVFALLALHQVQQMYVRRTAWRVLPVSLLAALTVMSHLEMAWFVAFSSALFFLSYARSWYGVRVSLAVAVLTALLSSPWWLTVVSHHGIGPIVAAMHTGTFPLAGPIILLAFDPTIEPLFALVASLALLGGFSCVLHRRYLLPAWVVAAACFDVRAFATSSTVPIAMLAAIGVQDVLLPAVRHYALFRPSLAVREGAPRPLARPPAWAATAVLGAIIAYATLSAFITAPKLLAAMHPEERDAMAWVAANTPADSRFVIISEDKWPVDRTSEWFPTLTHRESIATVQGAEWLPSGVFAQKVQDHLNLQKCSIQLVACLDKWSADTGKTYDYVVIPKLGPRLGKDAQGPCCLSIRDSLAADPRFETVFDNDGARIFRLIAAQR